MAVACTALVVALGGTATAARTRIRSADIAPGAVNAKALGKSAVTTKAIADKAVATAKLADGAVTAAKLAPGTVGPPTGAAGGALSGTYPNPSLATGAVGGSQLQDGAVTSSKIAAGAISQAGQIADGTIALTSLRGTAWGAATHWGTVSANGCRAVMLVEGAGSPVKAGDLILPGVGPALPSGVFVAPAVAPADGQPAVLVCNNNGSPVDVGAPTFAQINYRLIR